MSADLDGGTHCYGIWRFMNEICSMHPKDVDSQNLSSIRAIDQLQHSTASHHLQQTVKTFLSSKIIDFNMFSAHKFKIWIRCKHWDRVETTHTEAKYQPEDQGRIKGEEGQVNVLPKFVQDLLTTDQTYLKHNKHKSL